MPRDREATEGLIAESDATGRPNEPFSRSMAHKRARLSEASIGGLEASSHFAQMIRIGFKHSVAHTAEIEVGINTRTEARPFVAPRYLLYTVALTILVLVAWALGGG